MRASSQGSKYTIAYVFNSNKQGRTAWRSVLAWTILISGFHCIQDLCTLWTNKASLLESDFFALHWVCCTRVNRDKTWSTWKCGVSGPTGKSPTSLQAEQWQLSCPHSKESFIRTPSSPHWRVCKARKGHKVTLLQSLAFFCWPAFSVVIYWVLHSSGSATRCSLLDISRG